METRTKMPANPSLACRSRINTRGKNKGGCTGVSWWAPLSAGHTGVQGREKSESLALRGDQPEPLLFSAGSCRRHMHLDTELQGDEGWRPSPCSTPLLCPVPLPPRHGCTARSAVEEGAGARELQRSACCSSFSACGFYSLAQKHVFPSAGVLISLPCCLWFQGLLPGHPKVFFRAHRRMSYINTGSRPCSHSLL